MCIPSFCLFNLTQHCWYGSCNILIIKNQIYIICIYIIQKLGGRFMIGILIVTHGNFGIELLKSAELIIGGQENVETLSFNHGDDVKELHNEVNKSIRRLDMGKGVLVFTDLFGGSPSNVTIANMKKLNFESISGVNLPMIIEALASRHNSNLEELVNKVIKSGVNGIKYIKI